MIVLITTLNKKTTAVTIGKGLLADHLIACYNLFPIESAYWWNGKLLEGSETMLLMKTRGGNFKKIEKYIKAHSGYEIPEVIALEPEKVNFSYLKWVDKETN